MRLTTSPRPPEAGADYFYPDSDGRPVGETPAHFRNLRHLVEMLEALYAGEPRVYVAGNMFLYYVPGDRLKHVSPDLFVVRGGPKDKPRRKYLLWEEGKGPDLVVELTSESTRDEDLDKKWLYRDILGVSEYVLFDPFGEYLVPSLLGLHFEAHGENLRLYDPATGGWLRTPPEEREFAAKTAAKLDQSLAAQARLEQELAELRRRLAGTG